MSKNMNLEFWNSQCSKFNFNPENLKEHNEWAWTLLNHNNPKVRAEASYIVCEYIVSACGNGFPPEEGWNIIRELANDSSIVVREKILKAIGDFYPELPRDKLWDLTLYLLDEDYTHSIVSALYVAIQKSKEYAELKDYKNASEVLKIILIKLRNNNLNYYFFLNVYLHYLSIDLSKLKRTIINISGINASIVLFLLYFILFIQIFLQNGTILLIMYFILVIMAIIGALVMLTCPFLNSENLNMVLLGNGLYNYFKGRYYISNYLESRNSVDKLKNLRMAVKNFEIATKIYINVPYGFNELRLCPYCFNFYQSIEIYEDIIRRPEKAKINDLESNIEKAKSIMAETGQGSINLTNTLNELLKAINLLVNLEENRKKFPNVDFSDRIGLDNQIKQKSKEINDIIQNINKIISNIEDQDLPLIIEIIKSKREELDVLSKETQSKGIEGLNKFYSREIYDYKTISLLIIGVIFLIVAYYMNSINYALIGLFFSIISSLIMAHSGIKRKK